MANRAPQPNCWLQRVGRRSVKEVESRSLAEYTRFSGGERSVKGVN